MEEEKQICQGDTFEGQTIEAKVAFLAKELSLLKKQVEVHSHNIGQIVREVRRLNEKNWANEIDDLKMRLDDIQAKSHRKFGPKDTGPQLG